MRFVFLFAAIAIISSCKSPQTMQTPTLTGGSEDLYRYQWNLSELNGKPAQGAQLLLAPGQVNRVTGNTSCNNMNGSMALKADHQLKFGPLAVTRRACMGENVEAPFLKALEQATAWSISDRVLTLYNGNVAVAKFTGADVSTSAGLPDQFRGTWELEYITGPRIAFEGLYPEKKPTLVYEKGDEYGGNTSCNGMGGKLKASGSSLSFNPPITTMMACPGNGEQTFLKTLAMVDGYALDSDKLLLKSKGLDVMRFRKVK